MCVIYQVIVSSWDSQRKKLMIMTAIHVLILEGPAPDIPFLVSCGFLYHGSVRYLPHDGSMNPNRRDG